MALKLTLMLARTSLVQDRLDALIDARSTTAARIVRQLSEDDAKVLLFAAVTSVDPRWKFPLNPDADTPQAKAEAVADRTRRALADCLIENPQAIRPMIAAVSDAIAHHDPRRRDDEQTEDAA
ncbi:hypothetical protein [Dietzia cercidiphylli]|uniref:Uncharacterized protein n=1 Tax=Dietzia cercidiphylli TaxID=498199 RepID=A0ABP4US51_9ACTN|nr:hypothetical protein [Dietzia cercidiphylli]MBB1047753.1 hypothetical protein [Dietzia cercidiphylli]